MNVSSADPQKGSFAQLIPISQLQGSVPGLAVVSELLAYVGIDVVGFVSFVFITFSVFRFLRHVSSYVSSFLFSCITSSLSISPKERVHYEVLQWLSKNVVDEKSWFRIAARSLTVVSAKPWDDMIQKFHGAKAIDEKSPSIKYVPALSSGMWFFHQWHPVIIWGEAKPTENNNDNSPDFPPRFQITTVTREEKDPVPMIQLLYTCREHALIVKSSVTAFRKEEETIWGNVQLRPTRPLETVDIDEDKKNDLLEDIRNFLRQGSPRWYARRGILYMRGYPFHGPPGTEYLFETLPPKCCVLLEDIDSAGVRRENMRQSGSDGQEEEEHSHRARGNQRQLPRITLSGLLNAIDGVTSQKGRILIMTTNNPDALDKALIRPGRVDLQVFFGPVSRKCAESIFMRMYKREPDEEDDSEGLVIGEALHSLPGRGVVSSSAPSSPRSPSFSTNNFAPPYDIDKLRVMAGLLASGIPPGKFIPAEIQGFLLSKMTDPAAALAEVEAWVAITPRSKESGRKAFEGEVTTETSAAAGSNSHAGPRVSFANEVISTRKRLASLDASSTSSYTADDEARGQSKAQPAKRHAPDAKISSAPPAKVAEAGGSPRPHANGAFYTPKGAEESLEELEHRKRIDEYFKSCKPESVECGVP